MKLGIMIDRIASGSAPKVIGHGVRYLKKAGNECEAVVLKNIVQDYSEVYKMHMRDVHVRNLMDEYPPFVRRMDFKIPGFSFFSAHHLFSPHYAAKVIRPGQYDALVVHGTYTCFTAKKLKRKHGIDYLPFIWDPMSYIFPHIYSTGPLKPLVPVLRPLAEWADRDILTDCLAVITSGRLHHELLRRHTDKDLEILYPGCYPVEEPAESREKFILTFDRWDIGNTPHGYLDILERLDRDVSLVVGGHWYPETIKQSFEAEVARRGLGDRVKIIGPLNEQMIIEWCSKAYVHVHLNKEAFGMQALEAAACGCPVMIPKGSGAAELFQDGIHGFFPEEGDVEAHVEALQRLFSDYERARKMGRAAHSVARHQTWEKHGQDLWNIIKKHKQ